MIPLKLGMDNDEGYDYKKDFEERFKPRFRKPRVVPGGNSSMIFVRGAWAKKNWEWSSLPRAPASRWLWSTWVRRPLRPERLLFIILLNFKTPSWLRAMIPVSLEFRLKIWAAFKEKIYEEVQDIEGKLIM